MANTNVRPRALVVDDSADTLRVIGKILENQFELSAAMSANDALRVLDSSDIDLFLIDIELGLESGFSLYRKLREREKYANTPVYFVSAYNNPIFAKQALEMGAEGLIAKSGNLELLAMRLRGLSRRLTGRRVRKLLIVDLGLSGSAYLSDLLREMGYSVIMTSDVVVGLELLKKVPVDRVVLTDSVQPLDWQRYIDEVDEASRDPESAQQLVLLLKVPNEDVEMRAYAMGFDEVIEAGNTHGLLAKQIVR